MLRKIVRQVGSIYEIIQVMYGQQNIRFSQFSSVIQSGILSVYHSVSQLPVPALHMWWYGHPLIWHCMFMCSYC